MAAVVLLVLLASLSACFASPLPGDNPTPVKFYTIDLDLHPKDRWTELAIEFKDDVKYIIKIMQEIFPEELIPLIEEIAAEYDDRIEDPYAQEMKGVAAAMNISLGDIVFLNIIYDVSAFGHDNSKYFGKACTSIVSEDTNGQIWHARNLDYSFGEYLRKTVIGVHFQTGGKTSYSAITFPGYVGILTGQKPNGYTITVDERDQGNWWMNVLIALLDPNEVPISFLVRDTLAYFNDFGGAVENLAQTDTIAPVYFIIGGLHKRQGVVVTKARVESDDLWYMGSDHSIPNWFLVETNYDHWEAPPAGDDRRHPAIKAMKAMGQQQISSQNLYNVISTNPVKNNNTIYSVVMSASKPSLMAAWVRHPEA